MRRHRQSPLCSVVGHELIPISIRRLTRTAHGEWIRTKHTKHWMLVAEDSANIQIFHLLKWEKYRISKFMSSYHILEVYYAMEEDTRFPSTLLLIQPFIFTFEMPFKNNIIFPEKHTKSEITHVRNWIGLNDAGSGNQTKFGTYSFDCESSQSGRPRDITSLTHIAPNTRIETLNFIRGPVHGISFESK